MIHCKATTHGVEIPMSIGLTGGTDLPIPDGNQGGSGIDFFGNHDGMTHIFIGRVQDLATNPRFLRWKHTLDAVTTELVRFYYLTNFNRIEFSTIATGALSNDDIIMVAGVHDRSRRVNQYFEQSNIAPFGSLFGFARINGGTAIYNRSGSSLNVDDPRDTGSDISLVVGGDGTAAGPGEMMATYACINGAMTQDELNWLWDNLCPDWFSQRNLDLITAGRTTINTQTIKPFAHTFVPEIVVGLGSYNQDNDELGDAISVVQAYSNSTGNQSYTQEITDATVVGSPTHASPAMAGVEGTRASPTQPAGFLETISEPSDLLIELKDDDYTNGRIVVASTGRSRGFRGAGNGLALNEAGDAISTVRTGEDYHDGLSALRLSSICGQAYRAFHNQAALSGYDRLAPEAVYSVNVTRDGLGESTERFGFHGAAAGGSVAPGRPAKFATNGDWIQWFDIAQGVSAATHDVDLKVLLIRTPGSTGATYRPVSAASADSDETGTAGGSAIAVAGLPGTVVASADITDITSTSLRVTKSPNHTSEPPCAAGELAIHGAAGSPEYNLVESVTDGGTYWQVDFGFSWVENPSGDNITFGAWDFVTLETASSAKSRYRGIRLEGDNGGGYPLLLLMAGWATREADGLISTSMTTGGWTQNDFRTLLFDIAKTYKGYIDYFDAFEPGRVIAAIQGTGEATESSIKSAWEPTVADFEAAGLPKNRMVVCGDGVHGAPAEDSTGTDRNIAAGMQALAADNGINFTSAFAGMGSRLTQVQAYEVKDSAHHLAEGGRKSWDLWIDNISASVQSGAEPTVTRRRRLTGGSAATFRVRIT